jgi:hypothetical protein
MKRGLRAPFSTLEQRVEWLLAHQDFLAGKLDLKALVTAMKRDKLFSRSTFWSDVNLEEAIRQAKLRAREAGG